MIRSCATQPTLLCSSCQSLAGHAERSPQLTCRDLLGATSSLKVHLSKGCAGTPLPSTSGCRTASGSSLLPARRRSWALSARAWQPGRPRCLAAGPRRHWSGRPTAHLRRAQRILTGWLAPRSRPTACRTTPNTTGAGRGRPRPGACWRPQTTHALQCTTMAAGCRNHGVPARLSAAVQRAAAAARPLQPQWTHVVQAARQRMRRRGWPRAAGRRSSRRRRRGVQPCGRCRSSSRRCRRVTCRRARAARSRYASIGASSRCCAPRVQQVEQKGVSGAVLDLVARVKSRVWCACAW